MRRTTQDQYEEAGEKAGLTFTGDMPQNVNCKADWICNRCGERLKIRLSNITHLGVGCSKCKEVKKKGRDDYERMGAAFGLVLAGPIPRNVLMKATWKMQDGTVVVKSYNNMYIKAGREKKDEES